LSSKIFVLLVSDKHGFFLITASNTESRRYSFLYNLAARTKDEKMMWVLITCVVHVLNQREIYWVPLYDTSGEPTVVNGKHNQKVHSWVVSWMYWCQ